MKTSFSKLASDRAALLALKMSFLLTTGVQS